MAWWEWGLWTCALSALHGITFKSSVMSGPHPGRTMWEVSPQKVFRNCWKNRTKSRNKSLLQRPHPQARILLEIICQCPNGSELLCIHSAWIFQIVLITYILKKIVHIAKDWSIKVLLDVAFHQEGRPTSTWCYTFDNKIKCHVLNWAFWVWLYMQNKK